MKELDTIFQRNEFGKPNDPLTGDMIIFNQIFDNLDYIGHQTENKNGVFWLWRNEARDEVEISGITDKKGNYAFVRYRNQDTSFEFDNTDRVGTRVLIESRFVGILKSNKDFVKKADFVSYFLNRQKGFEVRSVNLNTSEVYTQETNKELTNNHIFIFSVDFDFYHNIDKCDFNNLGLENC